jgi:hypothetical protein
LKEKIKKSDFLPKTPIFNLNQTAGVSYCSLQSHLCLLERVSDVAVKKGEHRQALY